MDIDTDFIGHWTNVYYVPEPMLGASFNDYLKSYNLGGVDRSCYSHFTGKNTEVGKFKLLHHHYAVLSRRDGTQKQIVLTLVSEFLKHYVQLIYERNQGKEMCERTMGRSTKYINRELTKYQTMSHGKKYVL